jgi:DNA-binding protein HU-beta
LNKADLVDQVARAASVGKKQAEEVLDAFFDTLRSATQSGDKVAWPGFGSFGVSQRAARIGRNPRTGEAVKIAASKVMKFTPSSTLKEFLNRGRAKKAAPARKASTKKATAKKASGTRKR